MFLPYSDYPNAPETPWVTYGLIAVNVAVFALLWPLMGQAADPNDPVFRDFLRQIAELHGPEQARAVAQHYTAYDQLVLRWGFRPGDPSPVALLTSMFLHGGTMHLLGNMLFLWIYADNVEHELGRLGFLGAYLGTGIAATLGDALLRHGSPIPAVGASGAISGVLGLYYLWFPRNRVNVFVFFFPLYAGTVDLPARLVLGVFVVVDNLFPLLLTGGQGGIAYGAHLGGFLGGLALAHGLNSLHARPHKPERPRRLDPRSARCEEILDDARSLESEDPRHAQQLYQHLLRTGPPSHQAVDACLGIARCYIRRGSGPRAHSWIVDALRLGPDAHQQAEAQRLLELLR